MKPATGLAAAWRRVQENGAGSVPAWEGDDHSRPVFGVSYLVPTRFDDPSSSPAFAVVQALTLQGTGCWQFGAEPLVVPICVGAELGALHARSHGLLTTANRVAPRGAGLLGGGLIWSMSERMALRAGAELASVCTGAT